ncbi:TVP38/TMEM64 family protein [Synechococcus sp. Cu2B8-bc1011]|uniref:TVP38/TMEM64 family protein n=1 Tax=Synechococcus sp. Cu2B8-bc1011 TaxID=3093725 RepID=UPI0039AFB012
MQRLRKIIGISTVVALAIVLLHLAHTHALEPLRAQVESMGVWAPLGIVALRGISILLPALPSSVYSLLAGALLGFETGLITIYITDLVFCQIAFLVAKRYGQEPVKKLVGEKASQRIQNFNQSQLEGNPFFLTGLLMTGLFDFVSYAAGLSGTKWKVFTTALIVSVTLSDLPIVALGAGVFNGGKLMLIIASLGVFALAIIAGMVKKYQKKGSKEP